MSRHSCRVFVFGISDDRDFTPLQESTGRDTSNDWRRRTMSCPGRRSPPVSTAVSQMWAAPVRSPSSTPTWCRRWFCGSWVGRASGSPGGSSAPPGSWSWLEEEPQRVITSRKVTTLSETSQSFWPFSHLGTASVRTSWSHTAESRRTKRPTWWRTGFRGWPPERSTSLGTLFLLWPRKHSRSLSGHKMIKSPLLYRVHFTSVFQK